MKMRSELSMNVWLALGPSRGSAQGEGVLPAWKELSSGTGRAQKRRRRSSSTELKVTLKDTS
jgi:hypothetical protein